METMIYRFDLIVGSGSTWTVYSKQNPFVYLEETKKLDIKQGWDGKNKLPVRDWHIENAFDISLQDFKEIQEINPDIELE